MDPGLEVIINLCQFQDVCQHSSYYRCMSILARELHTFDLPHLIIHWITNFLEDRKQRVRLRQDCHSCRGPTRDPTGSLAVFDGDK